MTATTRIDPHDARRPQRPPPRWAEFTAATVLEAADVHVALTLVRLGGEDPGPAAELVGLGAAFAVRAVRNSSVIVDLATVAESVTVEDGIDVDLAALPWPDLDEWLDALRASSLVAVGDDDPAVAPLRLLGTTLSLDRYWRQERHVSAELTTRIGSSSPPVDQDRLRTDLDALFGVDGDELQRQAAAVALLRPVSVIAGGPGTGKTTTVAVILALLAHQPTVDGQPLRVALAAPTGKAAARLQEAVHAQVATMALDEDQRAALLGVEASTIHRLLGWRPDSQSRFRHDATNQLPHHVVIVDETSMVSLTQMSRLLEAVRPTARLVLVGDPQQLTSVEAGAVLGDIVGPVATRARMTAPAAEELRTVTQRPVDTDIDDRPASVGDGIVVLRTVFRFGGAVGGLARAIESGRADDVVDRLAAGDTAVQWIAVDAALPGQGAETAVRDAVLGPAADVVTHARGGDAAAALVALRTVQVLCAHRRGPHGVARWRNEVERWLAEHVSDYRAHGWFAGRPVLVTANDYALDLYNGDTGVVVDDGDRLQCAFERRGGHLLVSPSRLSAVETMYAMTIHKSQGSQFGRVVVVLPDETSPILTRELLYTAVTRAQDSVVVVGTEAAVRAAVERPVNRASGLHGRLWA